MQCQIKISDYGKSSKVSHCEFEETKFKTNDLICKDRESVSIKFFIDFQSDFF